MQLIKSDRLYVARCTYDERHIPKEAGFRWDGQARRWWTDKPEVATRLRQYASEALGEELAGFRPINLNRGPQLTLRPDGLGWVFRCARIHNALAKEAGFRWSKPLSAWITSDPTAALKLRAYAEANVLADLERIRIQREEARLASRATDADIVLPCPPGMQYLGYQRAGIAYGLNKPGVLIGDEMGLGKTIQAIGIMNADPTIARVLVLCPATLKLNWQREIRKWSTRPTICSLATTTEWTNPAGFTDKVSVTIAHYDIFSRQARTASRIRAAEWDMMVIDEGHLLKNPKAGRTQMILGAPENARDAIPAIDPIRARRTVVLTGTPMVNRPIEIWPIANFLAPAAFNSWHDFARRYCGWAPGRGATGATNLDELQDKLRETIMIRRLKRDVLAELPAKLRQVIELPVSSAASTALRAEGAAVAQYERRVDALRAAVELAKASDNPADYDAAVSALRQGMTVAFTELSRVRHEVALAKVPDVIAHVSAVAEEGGKLILFAHHRDVMEALAAGLAHLNPVQIHGGVAMEDRQGAVDTFQKDRRCKLFIGQMTAAGVGITLTASSHVIFAELDWVPGNLSQCEDRAHRIGQHNSVLVQHLVLEGSLDARMAQVLVEKQRILDGALDDDTAGSRAAREAAAAVGAIRPGVLTAAQAAARLVLAGMSQDDVNTILERQDWRALRTATRARLPEFHLTEEEAMPPPFRAIEDRRRALEIGSEAATREARREQLEAEGRDMTPAQIEAVHRGLRFLAGMDTDRALERNGIGYNGVDSNIGHALAERDRLTPRAAALGRKLLRKYRRQLGAELIAEMAA